MVLRAMDKRRINCLFVLFVSNFSGRKGQLVFGKVPQIPPSFIFEALKDNYNAYYF
jgi:hypothetical protein